MFAGSQALGYDADSNVRMWLATSWVGTMSNDRMCHECGTTALEADRYCAECGQALIEPAWNWPRPVTSTPIVEPVFIPLDIPPDTGIDAPAKNGWLGGLLRSRSA
jgi:hypothetical protein